MPSKRPSARNRPVRRDDSRRPGEVFHHAVRIEGKLSGFWGVVAALVCAAALLAVLVLGLMTLTVVLWIACGALLLAIVTALFRALTRRTVGMSRPPPGAGS
jgi:Flp pilus assembly protein TadB